MAFLAHLLRHPFPVVAHFERVIAVSFAFPEAMLRPLVPEPLEIDTYEGLGFLTVAMVWTQGMRPAVFPPALGRDFFLAGYRVFTRFRDDSGRRLRGLRILRSETDRRSMVRVGNFFTRYRYRHVDVRIEEAGESMRVRTTLDDGTPTLDIALEFPAEPPSIPAGSPFSDWATARRFAGPMPFTFSPEEDGSVVVIEGSRQNWVPRPIIVKEWQVGFFDTAPLNSATPVLANAFTVSDVAYRWEKGRTVGPEAVA